MKTSFNTICLAVLTLSLTGCGVGGSDHQDLLDYVEETKNKPSGRIQEIPAFRPYEAFIYSAAGLRSPFDRPLDVQQRLFASTAKNVQPNFNRAKEYLERFDFNSLQMVGTIKKAGVLWALIEDSSGGIHRAASGNYIGKNHGRIVETTETKLEVVEIVSDGLDGWLERPRVLALSDKE